MTENVHALLSSQKRLLAVQGVALVLVTLFLINILSGGKGLLLLAAIPAAIAAIVLCTRPHWGVLMIMAAWITQFNPIGVAYLSIPYVVSALLMVPFTLSILRHRDVSIFLVTPIKILLVLGVLFLLSTLWSDFKYPVTLFPDKDDTASTLWGFLTRLIWLFFFVYFMRSRKKVEATIWLLVGLLVPAVLSAYLQDPNMTGRATASFGFGENANRLAFMSLFAASILWFYRSHAPTPRWKLVTLPFLGFMMVMALAAGSRSGFLQLMVLVALILKEQHGWSAAKRLRSVLLLGSLGIFLLIVIPSQQLARITTYEASAGVPGGKSLKQRLARVFNAADMIASDPIFGIGIGNFAWINRAFYPPGGDAHNSYLKALSEGGIPIFVTYLSLFCVTYRMLRRLERTGPAELLWIIKALRVNWILFLIFTAFADFWGGPFIFIIVGLTVAITHLNPSELQGASVAPPRSRLAPA